MSFQKLVTEKEDIASKELMAIGVKFPENRQSHWSTLPEGWREITEAEFAQLHHHHYSFRYKEFTQAVLPENTAISNLSLLWFWDATGYCVYPDYWKKKVRFFLFGCAHKYDETRSSRRNEWHYKCSICGHQKTVDTSD